MSVVNKPKVSKAIALTYGVLFAFIASVSTFFLYTAFFTPLGLGGVIASAVSALVGMIMLLIFASLYRTRYVLTSKELVIRTTILIGGSKTIPLATIESVKKTMLPFGIKLFGASFHGGYYYIPSLGRAFLAITNFDNGLLIKTLRGNYVITPSNPLGFKEAIEARKKEI